MWGVLFQESVVSLLGLQLSDRWRTRRAGLHPGPLLARQQASNSSFLEICDWLDDGSPDD